jgi:ABC-2 type transport system permease protein
MRVVRLLWSFLRLGILTELAYRTNFLFQLFQSLLEFGIALSGLAIVFTHTKSLSGWQPAQLLVLLGVYMLVGGLINLLIQPSMQQLMEDVRMGTLDFTLLKPEDAQLLVSIQRISVWKIADVLLGSVVLCGALLQPGTFVGREQLGSFALALLAGGAIIYSFWLLLATCSFWLVRLESILAIFQNMYQAGRWPMSIYPSWLRFLLTFFVPIALATTVPAEALAGHVTGSTLFLLVCGALLLLAVSRWFWKRGVQHYTGASA